MNSQLLIGLILTILPVFELRAGLPVIIDYCLKNNLLIWPYFTIVLMLNILVIFLIFLFLDFFHNELLNFKSYKKFSSKILNHTRKKAHKINQSMEKFGFIALMIAVAIPLPGTGAWTGTLVAWILGLNRLKSFIAISLGVILAGLIILLASLGLLA